MTVAIAARGAGPARRRLVSLIGTATMVLAAAATAYTWSRARWEHLALNAVTVDIGAGLWSAASTDRVRFVIADGHELSQLEYRLWLVAHPMLPIAVLVDQCPSSPVRG